MSLSMTTSVCMELGGLTGQYSRRECVGTKVTKSVLVRTVFLTDNNKLSVNRSVATSCNIVLKNELSVKPLRVKGLSIRINV